MLKFFIISIFLFTNQTGIAQEIQEIETDRPDQTECSSVIPQRSVQIETGILQESDMNTTTLFVPTTLIRLGAFKKAEFRIIVGEYFSAENKDSTPSFREKGFSPVSIGTKVFICEEKQFIPQTSLLFHLNHENSKFSFNKLSYDFRFSLSHTLSKRLDLGYNLGGEWNRDENNFTWVYTLTTAYSFTDKLGTFIEVFGGIAKDELPTHQFDAGITFLLLKNLQFDCSGGIALNENSPDKFISAGVSWRIPR